MKFFARLMQKPSIAVKPVGKENVQPGADKELKL
jgi:hypothetical protein